VFTRGGMAMALCVALAACGSSGSGSSSSSSAPGVTASTVTIGSHQPLTGVAAPGYSEIAPAAKAFFAYINAHGGINGRTINYIYKDDAYDPTQTVNVVKQLVLQNGVFGIFQGLGTPTHTKVVSFLNANKVPDLFVASGCSCWNNVAQYPYTFGWQTDYIREGKILGQYITQHFAGKKIAYFLQNDDFGMDGEKGLDMEIPASNVVTKQFYQPGNINVGPQIAAIKASGAQVLVNFTVPAYTALEELTAFKLGYHPQVVTSNVGSDPLTLDGLLKSFSKGAANGALISGMITDAYLPPFSLVGNPWIQLFTKVHQQYDPSSPLDGNVLYGMASAYTFVAALKAAGKDLTRQSIVNAVQTANLAGPGLVPYAYSSSNHSGFTGVQMALVNNNALHLIGTPLTTDDTSGPIQPYTTPQPTPSSTGVLPAGS
jgi:ABC-type branched-subunit amino acid transport system substrate-binding protein